MNQRMRVIILLLFPLLIWAQDHLLITEMVVTPTDGEFVEIHNPTASTIDLSDYYLTDATFSPGGAFYYNIVRGSDAGGGGFGDFHARFPAGASIQSGEYQVIAMNGVGFISTYGLQPTYELYNTDSNIPDMREALPGSINNQGGLTNSGEVVILYFWDGQSDLVQDVDYVVWGDKAEAVDKSGISIDGPDADNTPSTYLNDTPINQQISVSPAEPHAFGQSIQRLLLLENGETHAGGNGITGHNETSENLQAAFQVGNPNPGSGPSATGAADGTGLVSIPFSNVNSNTDVDVPISIVGVMTSPIQTVQVDVPLFWNWSGSLSDLELEGSAFQNATADITLEDGVYQILITNAEIGLGDTATVQVQNLHTPEDTIRSIFWVQTAGEGGQLKFVSSSPIVSVNNGTLFLIYDLQKNSANFSSIVRVRGVTTLGSGLLRKVSSSGDSLTTAYIQDNSGRGINLFRFGIIDPLLQRGNYVEVQGTVTEFELVTEIEYSSLTLLQEDFALPEPIVLDNTEVNSPRWDGTLIQTRGVVIDKYSAGGGTTIVISDGVGTANIRVWDTTELDLTEIEENVPIIVEGVGGVFVSSSNDTIYQILPAYPDQIRIDETFRINLGEASLEVEPFPFVPDRGERITISYDAAAINNHVTIRIFDVGGRIIRTLLDEDVTKTSGTIAWDGRNELRDLVPLGTYICHMEVLEPRSGEKKTFTAPIIVGTTLK